MPSGPPSPPCRLSTMTRLSSVITTRWGSASEAQARGDPTSIGTSWSCLAGNGTNDCNEAHSLLGMSQGNNMGELQTQTLHSYSETWELGTLKGLSKTVLNSEVVLFPRFYVLNRLRD